MASSLQMAASPDTSPSSAASRRRVAASFASADERDPAGVSAGAAGVTAAGISDLTASSARPSDSRKAACARFNSAAGGRLEIDVLDELSKRRGLNLQVLGCQVAGNPFDGMHQPVSLLEIAGIQCGADGRGGMDVLRGEISQQFSVKRTVAHQPLQTLGHVELGQCIRQGLLQRRWSIGLRAY